MPSSNDQVFKWLAKSRDSTIKNWTDHKHLFYGQKRTVFEFSAESHDFNIKNQTKKSPRNVGYPVVSIHYKGSLFA